mgnify:CR=1 FL=1
MNLRFLVHLRASRQSRELAIAFFAKISNNVEHLGKDQVIVFDEVVTDVDSTNSLGKVTLFPFSAVSKYIVVAASAAKITMTTTIYIMILLMT